MRTKFTQQPVDDELQEFVNEVVRLYDGGVYDDCLALLSERITEAWFGFRPQKLVEMLHQMVASEQIRSHETGSRILNYFRSLGGERSVIGTPKPGEPCDSPSKVIAGLGQMIYYRQRGMSYEAYKVAKALEEEKSKFPFFYDSSWGLRQLVEVQSGISAMLAGEFSDALRYLLSAQLIRSVPSLRFLARDAYVKAALVHAVFGDFAESRGLLEQAEEFPRSSSWAEASIDSSAAIAQAVLAMEREDHGSFDIGNIPLHEVGEMWPFYIVALQRTYERRGQRHELVKRLHLIQEIPLPRVDGSGFTGSVLPLALATAKLSGGDLAKAREHVALADPSYVGTKVLELLLLSLQGEMDSVLNLSYSIRRQTAVLRQLDIFRLAITARAYLVKGERFRAAEVLRSIAGVEGGLSKVEMSYLGDDLIDFAQREISQWPTTEPVRSQFNTDLKYLRNALTEREIEALRLLGMGHSREEIAAHMYVTVNTVKTHLSSIYRKLSVHSRGEALSEAALRGLI